MPTVKSIKGIAYDAVGNPIADASVMIIDGSASFQDMAGISNEKGEFYLDNITLPGTYTVQIMWQGGIMQKTISLKETDSVITIRN